HHLRISSKASGQLGGVESGREAGEAALLPLTGPGGSRLSGEAHGGPGALGVVVLVLLTEGLAEELAQELLVGALVSGTLVAVFAVAHRLTLPASGVASSGDMKSVGLQG